MAHRNRSLSVDYCLIGCEQTENAHLLHVDMADLLDAGLLGGLLDRGVTNAYKTQDSYAGGLTDLGADFI